MYIIEKKKLNFMYGLYKTNLVHISKLLETEVVIEPIKSRNIILYLY